MHGYWLPCILSNEYKLWELKLLVDQDRKKLPGLNRDKTIKQHLQMAKSALASEAETVDRQIQNMHENSMRLHHRLRFIFLAQEHCCISLNGLFFCLFILMKGKCVENCETTFSYSFFVWSVKWSPNQNQTIILGPFDCFQSGSWSKFRTSFSQTHFNP